MTPAGIPVPADLESEPPYPPKCDWGVQEMCGAMYK